MIGADDLAWGDLSRFHTIVTGVRAYERRADLRANNSRLIDYVRNGGTLIVQYNKFEFNDAQYGPYPAVGERQPRDRRARASAHRRARASDVHDAERNQRRGVGRLGAGARAVLPRARTTRATGPRHARRSISLQHRRRRTARSSKPAFGKGRWIYVGLGLWRELPAGVPGAYQLLANLISLGTRPGLPLRQSMALHIASSSVPVRPARLRRARSPELE